MSIFSDPVLSSHLYQAVPQVPRVAIIYRFDCIYMEIYGTYAYSKNSQTLFVLLKFTRINYNQISDKLK